MSAETSRNFMNTYAAHLAMVGATLLACGSTGASAKAGEERWIALSRTALAITGNIRLSPTRLHTERANFPLKVAADVPRFGGELGPVAARVLAVTAPTNPVLLNGNRLCGGPVRWIVVSHTKDGALELDAFDSKRMPASVKWTGFCGSSFYTRASR